MPKLSIVALSGDEIAAVDLEPTDLVDTLRREAATAMGCHRSRVVLVNAGVVLEDDELCIEKAKLVDGAVVQGILKNFVALLCADALKRFHAKNLTDTPITVTVGGHPKTLAAEEDWLYAGPDCDDTLIYLGSDEPIADEYDPMFSLEANDDSGHCEAWELEFHVKGRCPGWMEMPECSAKIAKWPETRSEVQS